MTRGHAMSPAGSLAKRRALVTGGCGGIGYGIAMALAGQGAALIIHDLDDHGRRSEVEAGVRGAGAERVDFAFFDLASSEVSRRELSRIRESGHVDILVNNAGVQSTEPLASMSRATWDMILAVNLSAAFDTMRCFLPSMAERSYGRVVNIASVHGLVASVHKAAYVAAKHGLLGLTKVAALEYASAGSAVTGGVTVNAICPGWTETPLIEPQIERFTREHGGRRDEGVGALLAEKQPSLRFTHPTDIGALVCFLASDAAHNITGTSIAMDGGWTAL